MNVVSVVVLVLVAIVMAAGAWLFVLESMGSVQEEYEQTTIIVLKTWARALGEYNAEICMVLKSIEEEANIPKLSLVIGREVVDVNTEGCDLHTTCTVCTYAPVSPGTYTAKLVGPSGSYHFVIRVPEYTPTYNLWVASLGYPAQWDTNIEYNVPVTVCNDFEENISTYVSLTDVFENNTQTQDVNMDANGCSVVYFGWTPAVPGEHTLRAVIDPNNTVQEYDETDNALSADVQVFETYAHIMRGGSWIRLPFLAIGGGASMVQDVLLAIGGTGIAPIFMLSGGGSARPMGPSVIAGGGGWDCNDDTNCYLPT